MRPLLWLAAMAFVCAAAPDATFGELAQERAPLCYGKMLATLTSLTNVSTPDLVHAVRHNISDVRNLLDIFVFVFPKHSGPKGEDVWPLLREDLDVGYTVIGDFQDLSHSGVNYTHHDLKKRLKTCLKWKASFLENEPKHGYDAFIRSALDGELVVRPSHDYSKDFWEYIGITPSLAKTGLENLAALERGIIGQLAANYSRVVALTNIWDDAVHADFHDYRKLFRSANTVYGLFPAIYGPDASCNVTLGVDVFETAYNSFGDLNDKVTAYQFYMQHGKHDKAAQVLVEVQDAWAALVAWMKAQDLPALFRCQEDALRA